MNQENEPHVCPWWIGYFLLSPLRRIAHNPDKILAPYIRDGMTVLEIGPGMGFFTLPLARLVGKEGRVVCVDIQEKMLERLKKRAARAGVLERITATLADKDSLRVDELANKVDFVLAFAVVHEVPNQARFFEEIYRSMKSGSLLLVSEPKGRVTDEDFRKTTETARAKGFAVESSLDIKRNLSILLKK
jgi:ubiquinone/menaquinone biosynthesis C-methylase UbiE